MRDITRIAIHQKLFFLLVLLLPTQLGYHFWPFWSLVMGRRVDYLSPTLFFTDILIFFVLVTWVIPDRRNFKSALHQFSTKQPITLVVSVLWIIITIFYSLQPWATVFGWIKVIECGLLFLYIKKTNPSLRIIFFSFSLSVLFFCCLGMMQVIHQGTVGGIFWFLGERSFTISTPNIAKGIVCLPQAYSCFSWLRPYATFPHPNVFGGFLGVYIVFFLTKFHSVVKKSPFLLRILSFVTFGVASLGLLISFSRAAWVGLITATTLYGSFLKSTKNISFMFS